MTKKNYHLLSEKPQSKLPSAQWVTSQSPLMGTLSGFDPKALEKVAQENYRQGVTFAYIPQNFSFRALFMDFDSTMVEEESLSKLAKYANCEEIITQWTQETLNGNLNFHESLTKRLKLFKGLHKDKLKEVSKKLTLTKGLESLLGYCKEKSIPVFVLSGGFVDLIEPVLSSFAIEKIYANQFAFENSCLTGELVGPLIGQDSKKELLMLECEKRGLTPSQTVFVGDSANDRSALSAAGFPVGFGPEPVIYPYIQFANFQKDHQLLTRFLQNI